MIICYALLDDDGTRKESWNTNCLIEPVSMKNKKQQQSKTADIYARRKFKYTKTYIFISLNTFDS